MLETAVVLRKGRANKIGPISARLHIGNPSMQPQQKLLNSDQIKEFQIDIFAQNQSEHFSKLLSMAGLKLRDDQVVVDVGGGIGVFAAAIRQTLDVAIRVIDSDSESIKLCQARNDPKISANVGDALALKFSGDEAIACFNLILHHLIGKNDRETRMLQLSALEQWHRKCDFIFVNEYIYDSFACNLSGRIIYEITRSKPLSFLAEKLARFFPSLRANTLGTGVRFRGDSEWRELFQAAGFQVVGSVRNQIERVPTLQRVLLIREIRRDSYLLKPNDLRFKSARMSQ